MIDRLFWPRLAEPGFRWTYPGVLVRYCRFLRSKTLSAQCLMCDLLFCRSSLQIHPFIIPEVFLHNPKPCLIGLRHQVTMLTEHNSIQALVNTTLIDFVLHLLSHSWLMRECLTKLCTGETIWGRKPVSPCQSAGMRYAE